MGKNRGVYTLAADLSAAVVNGGMGNAVLPAFRRMLKWLSKHRKLVESIIVAGGIVIGLHGLVQFGDLHIHPDHPAISPSWLPAETVVSAQSPSLTVRQFSNGTIQLVPGQSAQEPFFRQSAARASLE